MTKKKRGPGRPKSSDPFAHRITLRFRRDEYDRLIKASEGRISAFVRTAIEEHLRRTERRGK